VVYSETVSFSADIQLPLEKLAPGAYFIELEFSSTTLSKRFIKF
jgi:hypothetical protein